MDLGLFRKLNDFTWMIEPHSGMRVPGIIYGSQDLILGMDNKVYEQLRNVATLPGIVQAAYAMPDAHWGYGFPIGGVAAFDAKNGGVISAGGVGFDISCGVRLLQTHLKVKDIRAVQKKLADALFAKIPAGVGSQSHIRLTDEEMNAMLLGGARWAVDRGYGRTEDLERIEEHGCVDGAATEAVSERAKKRQQPEMGTLGSGNHYLEVQEITEIYDEEVAKEFKLEHGDVVISMHCGSRGLGHQIGTEYLQLMSIEAKKYGIELPDRELACAPIESPVGHAYIGAMRSAINCALANREILTHFTRGVFAEFFANEKLPLVFDVSHNTCKEEIHEVEGERKSLFVHRKGATRAFGPGHSALPECFRSVGQPVFVGGSMGTGSYVLVGTQAAEKLSFSSACHGAGRAMSRHQALKNWKGRQVVDDLEAKGILIRSPSSRGVAEEAPGAYKDVHEVIESTHQAGLAKKVARLAPLICVKG